jgi:hypothetical protein
MRIAGLAYAGGGSLAYPARTRLRVVPIKELLALVVAEVHPANMGPLPPSPSMLACKGEQIGLGQYDEFFRDVWW